MIYVWAVVIFVTVLAAMLWAAWSSGEAERRSLARLADPAPLPGELPVAGRFEVEPQGPQLAAWPRVPFTELADTGPLVIMSESMAAEVQLERAVKEMIEDAEQRIPPRWR